MIFYVLDMLNQENVGCFFVLLRQHPYLCSVNSFFLITKLIIKIVLGADWEVRAYSFHEYGNPRIAFDPCGFVRTVLLCLIPIPASPMHRLLSIPYAKLRLSVDCVKYRVKRHYRGITFPGSLPHFLLKWVFLKN